MAGGRVVGDPLAQPFSMGRNLFCVHSKKYIDIEEDKVITRTLTLPLTLAPTLTLTLT